MAKYVAGAAVAIAVTEYVRVEVPFGSLVAVLTLAELYQANGRHDEAIGLLQQLVELDPDPALVLSLCDLYAETGAWAEIIDVAAGTRNDDDISLQVRLFQAEALQRQGMNDAALEAYKDALRSTKRDGELIKAARYGRGRLYLQLGKKAQGRKDLERVYAADPHYRDVADLLTAASRSVDGHRGAAGVDPGRPRCASHQWRDYACPRAAVDPRSGRGHERTCQYRPPAAASTTTPSRRTCCRTRRRADRPQEAPRPAASPRSSRRRSRPARGWPPSGTP